MVVHKSRACFVQHTAVLLYHRADIDTTTAFATGVLLQVIQHYNSTYQHRAKQRVWLEQAKVCIETALDTIAALVIGRQIWPDERKRLSKKTEPASLVCNNKDVPQFLS